MKFEDTTSEQAKKCETTEERTFTAGSVSVPLDELAAAWSGTLPELFGHAVGANSVVE